MSDRYAIHIFCGCFRLKTEGNIILNIPTIICFVALYMHASQRVFIILLNTMAIDFVI